jgi:hypothetical protein
MLTTPPSPEGTVVTWANRLRDSALFRFAVSGLLVLILQIPIGLISHTVDERR